LWLCGLPSTTVKSIHVRTPRAQLVTVRRRNQRPLENANIKQACLVLLCTLHSTHPNPTPSKKTPLYLKRTNLTIAYKTTQFFISKQRYLQGGFVMASPNFGRSISFPRAAQNCFSKKTTLKQITL